MSRIINRLGTRTGESYAQEMALFHARKLVRRACEKKISIVNTRAWRGWELAKNIQEANNADADGNGDGSDDYDSQL